jgi:uncharacterized protein YecT (DUF1311 family)
MDKAASQAAMDECAGKGFKAADGTLNRVYGEVQGRLKGDDGKKKKLVAAEKAWIAFRDSECAFASSHVEGGSVYPLIYTECLETETTQRVDELKGYLDCKDGDLSCPIPPK